MSVAILERTEVDRRHCTAARHGDLSAYRHGCVCVDARAAYTAYRRALRTENIASGKIPRPGPRGQRRRHQPDAGEVNGRNTSARLRVLAGLGHDWASIAARLGAGHTEHSIAALAVLPDDRGVNKTIAVQVQALCSDLLTDPDPAGDAADDALALAIRKGWGVIDSVLVRRALHGTPMPLTRYERRAVVYTGAALGAPTQVLADAARVSWEAINRYLAA